MTSTPVPASEGGPVPAVDDGYRDRFLPIASWSLYDFANTMFSAMVVTLAMPRVLSDETGMDKPMSWASAGALLLSALVGPFLGALADTTGTTKRQVVLWSVLCCAGSVALSFVHRGHPNLYIGIFVLCFVAYNVAISLYDAFLPDLCSPHRMGFISGVGVGVGYLGPLIGYPLALWVQNTWGYDFTFAAAGVMMFVFSVPFFLFVRERSRTDPRPFTPALGMSEFRRAMRTLRTLPSHPPARRRTPTAGPRARRGRRSTRPARSVAATRRTRYAPPNGLHVSKSCRLRTAR